MPVGILQAAIADEQRDFGPDLETEMRAVLAEWSPDDTENLQALSILYREQENASGPASSCNSKPRRKSAMAMVLVWWRPCVSLLICYRPAWIIAAGWRGR